MKKIKIIYCKPCGYLPTAEKMKKELEQKFKDELLVELEPGTNGIYELILRGLSVERRPAD